MLRKRQKRIIVGCTMYRVTERAGIYRAAMNGVMGWTSVWGSSLESLALRIRLALRGGQ